MGIYVVPAHNTASNNFKHYRVRSKTLILQLYRSVIISCK